MKSFAPAEKEHYLALARRWAATVTVVTVRRAGEHVAAGQPELDGFTATAFLTVSMDPPIVAVSATASSAASSMLRQSAGFAVNLLSPSQAELAGSFARPAQDRVGLFDRIVHQPDAQGAPILDGAAGAWSARVRQLVEAGDHLLVLGDVTAVHLGEGTDTLVYHDRAYGRVSRG